MDGVSSGRAVKWAAGRGCGKKRGVGEKVGRGVTFSRRDQKLFIHLMSLCTARLRNPGDATLAGVGRRGTCNSHYILPALGHAAHLAPRVQVRRARIGWVAGVGGIEEW
ncbi:hypothetical protein E2C01_045080 [Portunus trituberculatus]|uniref:Uncharacterized protein n=1 Tax=Portunus trituberculatus TaxID=210409 RepID=A0A5B7G116_PORTR|nr:hypothetical protein [Portunus trituberculatus]